MTHARFTHEIVVPLPAGKAFPLFTPRGEEGWVPGWKPAYLLPESGETCENMVFTTGGGDDATIWTCLKWQPRTWQVRYLRVTPASRAAFVDVVCSEECPALTRVRVSYEFVALTESGRDFVAGMTPQSFAADIDNWSMLIREHLDKQGAA
ncbi:MAG: hypothetical protein ACTHLP_06195 [Rhizobiaceae bacterium]